MIVESLNTSIEKVVYINLERRADRKVQVESELSIFLPEKIVRFAAIEDNPGCIGCSKSHVAVLKMAIQHQWRNVLIVEDDLLFQNFDAGLSKFMSIVSRP